MRLLYPFHRYLLRLVPITAGCYRCCGFCGRAHIILPIFDQDMDFLLTRDVRIEYLLKCALRANGSTILALVTTVHLNRLKQNIACGFYVCTGPGWIFIKQSSYTRPRDYDVSRRIYSVGSKPRAILCIPGTLYTLPECDLITLPTSMCGSTVRKINSSGR